MTGSCEIQLRASGKYALENAVAFNLVPNDVRETVLYVIEECIANHHNGGFVTNSISNAIDWLVSPNSDFPGSLNLPQSASFFSVMVWNAQDEILGHSGFDPGSFDPIAGERILEGVEEALDAAPFHSSLRRKLIMRKAWVRVAVQRQISGLRDLKLAWWEGRHHGETLTLPIGSNVSSVSSKVSDSGS